MEYRTKDFYLAACILANKIQLIELSPINAKAVWFVFNTTPEIADEITHKYWQRELSVPLRDYVDAIHELKTRIYARS